MVWPPVGRTDDRDRGAAAAQVPGRFRQTAAVGALLPEAVPFVRLCLAIASDP
jgi:hypothetical protein